MNYLQLINCSHSNGGRLERTNEALIQMLLYKTPSTGQGRCQPFYLLYRFSSVNTGKVYYFSQSEENYFCQLSYFIFFNTTSWIHTYLFRSVASQFSGCCADGGCNHHSDSWVTLDRLPLYWTCSPLMHQDSQYDSQGTVSFGHDVFVLLFCFCPEDVKILN